MSIVLTAQCCPDVIDLICGELPVKSCLILSKCNRILRSIIFKGNRNNMWLLRWRRYMSETNLPDNKLVLLRHLIRTEFYAGEALDILLNKTSHDKDDQVAINTLDGLFYTGADKAIARILAKYTFTPDNLLTFLHRAIKAGHVNVVELLLQKGARVDDRFSLHLALQEKNLAIIRLLVERGAAQDAAITPYSAIADGNVELLKYLFDSGLRKRGECLDYALNIQQFEVADYLLALGIPISVDTLASAARAGHIKTLGHIFDSGVDVNAWDGAALRRACEYGKCDVVEYLINRKASLSYITESTIKTMRENKCEYLLNYLVGEGLEMPD